MAGKMILSVGIPGCGKSTWATRLKAEDPENVVVIERDQTRTHLFGEKYHRGNFPAKSESQVTRVNDELIRKGLREGKTVIVSDTNINPRNVQTLAKTARTYGADLSFEHFDVDPQECKRRNRARGAAGGREVPDHVMDRMVSQAYGDDGRLKEMKMGASGQAFFVARSTPGSRLLDAYNKKAEFANPLTDAGVVIVDCDGTLADNRKEADRAFGREGEKKNFPYFFRSIKNSRANPEVVELTKKMRAEGLNIVLLTGRSDEAAAELIHFLKRSGAPISRVYCKKEGDFRPDSDYKAEVIRDLAKDGMKIVHAIDDRPRSIAVWEQAGILVSRVEHHDPMDPRAPDYTGDYPTPKVDTIYGSGHCIKCGSALKDASKSIGPKCALGGKD